MATGALGQGVEITMMWKRLGMIKKRTQKYGNEILGNLSLARVQKILLNSTAHVFRRALNLNRNNYI